MPRCIPLALSLGLVTMLVTGVQADPINLAALTEHPLVSLEGEEFSLGDLKGQVVVVNFWASWCQPCRKELPELNTWSRSMSDVEFVAISVDKDLRKCTKAAEQANLSITVCHDGTLGLARKLDLEYLPCTVVLDTQGNIAMVTPGVTPERMEELHAKIQSLRTTAASTASSNPVGR